VGVHGPAGPVERVGWVHVGAGRMPVGRDHYAVRNPAKLRRIDVETTISP